MRILLAVIAVAGVVTSVAMTLVGLPEADPTQTVLLELSALPLSASVAAGLGLLHLSGDRRYGQRARAGFLAGAGLTLVGLLLIALAYVNGPRAMVHTGQLLTWLGLFAALIVVVRHQPKRRITRFEVEPEDAQDVDPDAEDAWAPEDAVEPEDADPSGTAEHRSSL